MVPAKRWTGIKQALKKKKKNKYKKLELDGLNITKHRPWGDKENKLLRENSLLWKKRVTPDKVSTFCMLFEHPEES